MRKRPLVPSFLQQFDTWLLKHTPAAWSARTHLLAWFVFIFSAIAALACYVTFSDARVTSFAAVWSTFIGMAAFTGFVIWLIYLLRFNVFKRFGNWKKWEGLKMFGLYFINIALLVFTPFIPYIIECANANSEYNNHELVEDINELNLTVCRLEHNLLPTKFKADTVELIKKDSTTVTLAPVEDAVMAVDSVVTVEEYDDAAVPAMYRANYRTETDTASFFSTRRNADSIIKLSDSVYVTFEAPEYQFAGSYRTDEHSTVKVLSSFEIYNKVIKNYTAPDRQPLLKRMQALEKKYTTWHPEPDYFNNKSYRDIIEERYNIRNINRSIDNIGSKKYWWQNDWQTLIRVFLYTSLIITLLVFIFRNTTVKTFFLSLLSAVILLIANGIIVGIFSLYNYGVLIFILLYYLIFFITALSIKVSAIRRAVQGIALNFTVFLTMFIPLVAVNLYFEILRDININKRYDDLLYVKRDLYNLYAEVGGVLLLLLLIEPVFRQLYKRWFAMPEE